MVAGKVPLVRVRQRGQVLTSALTRCSTVSKTMSISTRCSCAVHAVAVRSWPHCRHSVTGLVCVVVTVRRVSERVWRAFGPRLRAPDLPSVWVWPSSVASRELGTLELREVFGVVFSRNTATTISTSMNRALISARVSAPASPFCLMASNWARHWSSCARSEAWLIRAITGPRPP